MAPSGARTEQAQTSTSFPSALITALLVLLLAIAMVVVPKLRHRAVLAPAGAAARSRQTRAAPVPGPAAGSDRVPRPRSDTTARFHRQVIPMDSAIAPMAADAFSQMAGDADPPNDPREEPRADGEPED